MAHIVEVVATVTIMWKGLMAAKLDKIFLFSAYALHKKT